MPSLWVFLIIVLGVLLAVVTSSSILMGLLQRRRREALRRRVENGQVDLEALGIKRINVPQTELDKLPLYIYKDGIGSIAEESTTSVDEPTTSKDTKAVPSKVSKSSEPSPISPSEPLQILPAHTSNHFSQTSCSICLDDFVSNTTTVRELPCRHIFHPECVDPFLLEHSSACPVCKGSVLPEGFCPDNITNAMVRREQLVRRIHQRRSTRSGRRRSNLDPNRREGTDASTSQSRVPPLSSLIPQRIRSQHPPSSPVRAYPTITPVEMNPVSGDYVPTTDTTSNPTPLNSTSDAQPQTQVQPQTQSMTQLPSPTTNLTPPSPSPPTTTTNPPPPQPSSTSNNRSSLLPILSEPSIQRRRELARQRAVAHLERENEVIDQDVEQEARRLPVWRRAIGKIFPGLTG